MGGYDGLEAMTKMMVTNKGQRETAAMNELQGRTYIVGHQLDKSPSHPT